MSSLIDLRAPQATSESEARPGGATVQVARALLLCADGLSADDRNLTALLDFFGIPWTVASGREIKGDDSLPAIIDRSNFCVVSSASCLAEVTQSLDTLPAWMMDARSVYVYGFRNTDPCRKLLRLLSADAQSDIHEVSTQQALMTVTADCPEMCGPLSGMQVRAQISEETCVLEFHHRGQGFKRVIRTGDGEVFCAVMCRGVRFYLSTCCTTVNLGAPCTKYFDVRELFCSSVPITMYLKWAFADICWRGPETSACLIVDDPSLQRRYGFLRFRETLELMERHNFSTTIAFIPWNWARTNRGTVDIFRTHPDRFSLSIHGCDHTASEFASRSAALLNTRIKAAAQRMELLRQRTSLPYDRVMVFPQGAFSPETGRALKLNDFVAAVNTEVAPQDPASNQTTIADLWQVAIMKYGDFPLFTRRYLRHGIENFAFDALLGKPCLIVAHHEVFKDQGRELVEFITKLNSLKWSLGWRSLGDAIGHSFRVRTQADGTSVIQMYGSRLVVDNPFTGPREILLLKQEGDPDCVKAIMVNQCAISYTFEGGFLRFRVSVSPKESAQVRILYFDRLDLDPGIDGIGYRVKTRARRYLSEFRDNYLSRNLFLHQAAVRVKKLVN